MSDNRRMNSIRYAVDAYDGDMARRKCSKRTRTKYQWLLGKFIEFLEVEHGRDGVVLAEITRGDCERFLDKWREREGSTMALYHTVLNGFFRYLMGQEQIVVNPMQNVRRPKRKRPEDLDVVTITSDEVERMILATTEWDEYICLMLLAFTGVRKTALANLRRRDLDLDRGFVRYYEKGGKTITKPLPNELLEVLRAAEKRGTWLDPDEYVVPNRGPRTSAKGRSNKVIGRIVQDVSERARIKAHVHAFRAAFAVQFDEAHPDRIHALKELMGHTNLETTLIYLRRKNKERDMEVVRDLSWGSTVTSPVSFTATSGVTSIPAVASVDAGETKQSPSPLLAKLDELRKNDRARSA